MNYNDHPPAHFHAEYQEYEAIIEIATGGVTGKMPRRALNMIWVWLDQHEVELVENWARVRRRQPLQPVEPLS